MTIKPAPRSLPARHARVLALILALLMTLAGCLPCGQALAEGEATPAPGNAALYREGDQGAKIKEFKLRLRELGYFRTDNLSRTFSEATTKAVREFQMENGLEVTGDMTVDTWSALFTDAARPYVTPTPEPTPTPTPVPTPVPTPHVDYPERDADGYLPYDGEYVYENDDAGIWIYLTDSLQIAIYRYADEDVPLVWFETDIKMRDGERFLTVENNPKRPGTRFNYPYVIAQREGYILGFSDDFYGHRIDRGEKVGIVIRNGEIIGDETHSHETHFLPNLDIMAQYPDGTLKTYECNELTPEELLAKGAINVFCFGPTLVKDGAIGPLVAEGWFETKSPRQALGMIEPGHYMLLSVCGRMRSSIGCGLTKMAELMLARGVTEALNLDGGNTMALVFRGRMLNKLATWNNKKFVRTVTSLIGVGMGEYTVE